MSWLLSFVEAFAAIATAGTIKVNPERLKRWLVNQTEVVESSRHVLVAAALALSLVGVSSVQAAVPVETRTACVALKAGEQRTGNLHLALPLVKTGCEGATPG